MSARRHITAEAQARAFLDGWQAEERFKARRNARTRREALALQAGSGPIHRPACTPGGRSLPSGPAPSPRAWALIGLSAVGLTVAIAGYFGIALLQVGWGIVTRRG